MLPNVLLNAFVNFTASETPLRQALRSYDWTQLVESLSGIVNADLFIEEDGEKWKDLLKGISVCHDEAERNELIRVLEDPDVDIYADIEVALLARGVTSPGGGTPSSCSALWCATFLHWAERLAVAALDSPLLSERVTREVLLLREIRRLLREARQHYVADGGDAIIAPIAQRFLRLAKHLSAHPKLYLQRRARSANVTRQLLTLYCGRQNPQPLAEAAETFGWIFHVVQPMRSEYDDDEFHDESDGKELDLFSSCSRAYEEEVWKQFGSYDLVLFWNPLSFWQPAEDQWKTFYNIDLLANRMRTSGELVIGFPSVSPSYRPSARQFVWPARSIRWRYWKLQYWEGPTGYKGVADGCFRSHSTSATRLVSAKVLRATGLARGSAWFSAIDLAVLKMTGGASVLTCPHILNFEPDWLPYARLGRNFAQVHQIEAARWTQRVDPQVQCLVNSVFVASRLVSFQGVVTPWCFRRALHRAINDICDWWKARSSTNLVTPIIGSRLALLRGARPMPWDTDADLIMVSQAEFQFEQHAAAIADEVLAFGCTMHRCKQVVGEGLHYCSVLCLESGGIQVVLDLFFQGGDIHQEEFIRDWAQRDVVWPAQFAGASVHVDAQLVLGMAFNNEYAPKLMRGPSGLLQPLHCLAFGHNACLPDCRDATIPNASTLGDCELDADGFVLLEAWMPVGMAA